MKVKNLIVLASVAMLCMTAQVANADQEIPQPQLMSVATDYIFAPAGFDNNDNTQIVIHGQLPNTCYKTMKPAVRVDHASRRIYVSAMAYVYSGCFCLQVMTPFTQTIDLGLMSAGSYQVLEVNANGVATPRAFLPIGIAKSPAPDENLYAPVKSAIVDRVGGQSVLRLNGIFPSDCLELQRVVTLHRTARIIEVLPLAIQKPGVECTPRNRPFEASVVLSASQRGDNLIHIRSMNGNSINLVEEF